MEANKMCAFCARTGYKTSQNRTKNKAGILSVFLGLVVCCRMACWSPVGYEPEGWEFESLRAHQQLAWNRATGKMWVATQLLLWGTQAFPFVLGIRFFQDAFGFAQRKRKGSACQG